MQNINFDIKLLFLFILWIVCVFVSLLFGQYNLSIRDIFDVFFLQGDEVAKNILFHIRIPRILISSFCGGILAVCGVILQSLFKNPLVEPKIIGVSTGAAFGGCLAILLGFSGLVLVLFSFIFGLLALILLYYIVNFVKNVSIFTLVLSGIVVNGFFAALISLVQYMADVEDVLPNIIFWLLGSFVNSSYTKLIILFFIATPALIIIYFMRWHFNLFSLDKVELKALGVNILFLQIFVLLLCTLLISAQVSVSGNIGWIGLILPHIAKMLIGNNTIKTIPISFVLGMIFMLIIDNIARTITTGEVPLGILSALIGTPIFAFILRKNLNVIRG